MCARNIYWMWIADNNSKHSVVGNYLSMSYMYHLSHTHLFIYDNCYPLFIWTFIKSYLFLWQCCKLKPGIKKEQWNMQTILCNFNAPIYIMPICQFISMGLWLTYVLYIWCISGFNLPALFSAMLVYFGWNICCFQYIILEDVFYIVFAQKTVFISVRSGNQPRYSEDIMLSISHQILTIDIP